MASNEQDSNSDSEAPYQSKRKKRVKTVGNSNSEDDSDFETKAKNDHDSNTGNDTSNELSDNEQSDKCAICLNKFDGQDIATPEVCDHAFCLQCLQEWAKNVNTCPIDRLKFNLILIRHHKKQKIRRTINVSNLDIPCFSDFEIQSNTRNHSETCDLCGHEIRLRSHVVCVDCSKYYHCECLRSNITFDLWQCPSCDTYYSIKDCYVAGDITVETLANIMTAHLRSSPILNRNSLNLEIMNQRRLLHQSVEILRNNLTSDTFPEETFPRYAPPSAYSTMTSARSSLAAKRRSISIRNPTLVSSAAAVSTESSTILSNDSEDNEYYRNFNVLPDSPSQSFDLVGSILQSQALLHRPEQLSVKRDGSLLRSGKADNDPWVHTSPFSSPSHSPCSSPSQNSKCNDNICVAVGEQRPHSLTQNNNVKYTESSRQNHSRGTTSVTIDRPTSYEENLPSRMLHGESSDDRFGNEPFSSGLHKTLCSPAEAKKDVRKEKAQHSEDEVDIYSDIESNADDEDDVLSSKEEPLNMSFRTSDHPQDALQSHPMETTDSSDDNELVIDEDMPTEDAALKEHNLQTSGLNPAIDPTESEGESNLSSNLGSEKDSSSRRRDTSIACIENSNDNCYQPSEESSYAAFVNESNSRQDCDSKSVSRNGSESNANGSDVDVQACEDHSFGSSADDESRPHGIKLLPKVSEDVTNIQINCAYNKIINSAENISQFKDGEQIQNVTTLSNSSTFCEKRDMFIKPDDSDDEIKKSHVDGGEQINDQDFLYIDKDLISHADRESHETSNSDNDAATSQLEGANQMYEFSSNKDNESTRDSESQEESNALCEEISNIDNENTGDSVPQIENDNSLVENNLHLSNSYSSGDQLEEFIETANSEFSEITLQNESPKHGIEEQFNSNGPIPQTCEIKAAQNDDSNMSVPTSPIDKIECDQNENDSNLSEPMSQSAQIESEENGNSDFSFASEQPIESDEDIDVKSAGNVSNDKLEDDTERSEGEICDNADSFENVGTPCLDENIDGHVEYSPPREKDPPDDYCLRSTESKVKNTNDGNATEDSCIEMKNYDRSVDLGIEDISDAGSGELDEEFLSKDLHQDCIEEEEDMMQSNAAVEDQEEGEIIEERPERGCKHLKLKADHHFENTEVYGPQLTVSSLPRIPKLTRDSDVSSPNAEVKRNSVLSRVDLGNDISWKRLPQHSKERVYRDGKEKDEKLLFRERESRIKKRSSRSNKDKNSDRPKDDKKTDRESRSHKDEKSRDNSRSHSGRDRHEKRKSHKEKSSKHRHHSKDTKRRDKRDRSKHSKDRDRYEKEKSKDSSRHRDSRYDKEDRSDRKVHEKGKKDRDHKSKHKDRKNDSSRKSSKDRSRDKHKHSRDHSSDRQRDRDREIRKVDDKLKILLEPKEKLKHKDKKESKNEKKELLIRKRDRSPNSEVPSIESKEIFTKGDSIIINVNFSRNLSPKPATETSDNKKSKKAESEDPEIEILQEIKGKPKRFASDRLRIPSETIINRRKNVSPERNSQVLSVSENYWKGGLDPDVCSPQSEKSVQAIDIDDSDSMNSTAAFDDSSSSSSSSSSGSSSSMEGSASQSPSKDVSLEVDQAPCLPEQDLDPKENESFSSKRRSPRSPPSPVDNDSYDPCEPTRSPTPPLMPQAPPLPAPNPKPPPSPELPPLPPEPEPMDSLKKDASSAVVPNVTVQTQTPVSLPLSLPGLMLPPPIFVPQSASNSSPVVPSRVNFCQQSSQISPHPPSIPISHMSSLPPPPPPPTMTLISQANLPQISVTPSSLLQSLQMAHHLGIPQLQLPHLPGLMNHQSVMPQAQSVTLPPMSSVGMVLSQNAMPNHTSLLQTQTVAGQSQGASINFMLSQIQAHKIERPVSPSAEKNEVVDMDVDSPYSPADSSPAESAGNYSPACSPATSTPKRDIFDNLLPTEHKTPGKRSHEGQHKNDRKMHSGSRSSNETPFKRSRHEHKRHHMVHMETPKMPKVQKYPTKRDSLHAPRLEESQLKILDELPSSAVEMQVKEKFMKKLNRQERVVEEVKLVLKPFFKTRDVTKEDYKNILRKAVPKICHNKTGEINPVKVKNLVEGYVQKVKRARKVHGKKKSKFS